MKGLLVAVAALASSIATAQASEEITLEHYAPVPCSILCPYWEAGEAAGFDVCNEPGPPGSYDQTIVRFTETQRTSFIEITMDPAIDYDVFACTDTEPSQEIHSGACICPPPECDVDYLALGCREEMTVTYSGLLATLRYAPEDPRFIIRTYNWSDVSAASLWLDGPVEIVDDSFQAGIL